MTDQTPPPSPPAPPTEPAEPTTTVQPGPRRFRRSREDKVIAGVCGGLGRYFGIDPVLVRIAAVALLFAGGISAIAYIAAVIFVPEDGDPSESSHTPPSRAATVLGIAVLVIAAVVALPNLDFGLGWGWWAGPLIPIAVLCALLYITGQRLLRRRGEHDPSAGRILGITLMLIAACIAAGTLGIAAAWATAAGGGAIVAGVVIAIGVVMVLASFRGGARWLALPALLLALPAGIVAAAGIDIRGGVGQRTYRPVSATDLRHDYKLGAGQLAVDLRNMAWPQQTPVDLHLKLGVGHAVVYVPADVCVRAAAKAGAGYVNVLADESGGLDLNYDSGAMRPRHMPSLILDADIGMGAVEVRHTGQPASDHRGAGGRRDYISQDLANAGCAGSVA